jgi:hypothetical protein
MSTELEQRRCAYRARVALRWRRPDQRARAAM